MQNKQWLMATSFALGMGMVGSAWAQAQVKIEDAWVRGTVAQQKASGAFMRLTAPVAMKLVSASSPVASVVEVHEMAMEKDVMRMRAVPALELAPGQTTELKPGGYHVMLMDLKQPLQGGDTVSLTLVFEDANRARSSQTVLAPVRALGATAAKPAMDHGAHGKHEHKH
jgi:periplasmic copper chaperone A